MFRDLEKDDLESRGGGTVLDHVSTTPNPPSTFGWSPVGSVGVTYEYTVHLSRLYGTQSTCLTWESRTSGVVG